ncbi:MAG: YceI family protein [Pseudomonadota bacterium]
MRSIFAATTMFAFLAFAGCGSAGSSQETAVSEPPATALITEATDWLLDTETSTIAFASIKAGELIETHYFPGLTGEISQDGTAAIRIPLDLVETKLELRNERMRNMFFKTETHPTATIRAQVSAQDYADLMVGERRQSELRGTLSLHGVETDVFVDAFVTRIGASRIEIESSEPAIIYVSDFELEDGLEMLREVAGLPSITPAVPVTFSFVFDAQT